MTAGNGSGNGAHRRSAPKKRQIDPQFNSFFETVDFSRIEQKHANEIKFGDGGWWLPDSNELMNPTHPYKRLFDSADREVFRTLRFLCFTEKSFLIRITPDYVEGFTGGHPSARKIEQCCGKFFKYGLASLRCRNEGNRGNIVLVSDIGIASEHACSFKFFEAARRLTLKFQKIDAPPREKKKPRGDSSEKRQQLSRESSLSILRAQAVNELTPH